MSKYTAVAAFVCLAQIALASSDYGVNNNADYSPPNTYGGSGYGTDYGYDEYDRDDHKDTCREVRQLRINGQNTHRATVSEFERKGRTYLKISCRNHNLPYALVTERDGRNTTFETVTIPNTALLATGFNVDFVAQCRRHGRVVGEGVDGQRHQLRRITCVQLSAPSPITTL